MVQIRSWSYFLIINVYPMYIIYICILFPFQRSASFVRQQVSYPPIKCNRSRRIKARSPYHGCQDSYDSGIHTSDHEIFVWCIRMHMRSRKLSPVLLCVGSCKEFSVNTCNYSRVMLWNFSRNTLMNNYKANCICS